MNEKTIYTVFIWIGNIASVSMIYLLYYLSDNQMWTIFVGILLIMLIEIGSCSYTSRLIRKDRNN